MVDYTTTSGYVTDAKGRRQFIDRNDGLDIQGTYLVAKDRNQDRNSLLGPVVASGQIPDADNDDQLTIAIQALGSIPLWSQSVADAIKGYPLGTVVRDATPKYWRSTADKNLTTPGADGSEWVDFLSDATTQDWANKQFLPLVGGNVTGAMDWGSKTVASTVTHRFWSAGPPAEGDAAPDATLTIAGGTPGTANKGTMALSTGVFDLSETGQVLVPSILIFGGKDALNALTAEGRYVKSVPVAPNKRITDIWENADGRLVFGDGTTAPILASLSDLPLDPGQQIQTFVVSGDNSGIVTTKFPVAFKAGTVPRVLLRINNEPNSNAWTRVAHIALDANYNEVIDNTGFTWAATYFTSNSAGNSAVQFTLTVMAIGERQ
ncbi:MULTISPECIES: hypothetical protein [Acetobacter]|jgi:hypothetical protein|uniref:Tail fiber protein n=1 Tax=Acetobacter lovaniensis TaxID=104100 RepID=A0A841QH18_9PROT|nr:hypothetical protein [Acetobacter lovaniensis]MBB6457473.1 hypothetical protein [Acetobacter lovaniensis]MCP1240373.1 hypothetical protein [Acetobacter lovaniensis]NHN81771.1 hypothetical protein [Acetobacter lovaniensis]GBQ70920.1 hypothetical protein AA0474_2319 [Acetobacter lovaniensis NRIC 0474]